MNRRILLGLVFVLSAVILAACVTGLDVTVSFMLDEDEVHHEFVWTGGKVDIDFPANPEREGYSFEGWYSDPGVWNSPLTLNLLQDVPISQNMVLRVYARWVFAPAPNVGNDNDGQGNRGDRNQGDFNWGHDNVGYRNTGSRNQGNLNNGNRNIGDHNNGDRNQGNHNQGNDNIGNANVGHQNIGNENDGNHNQGNNNIGNGNQGNFNEGNNNIGNHNYGNGNIGDHNIGNSNQGNGNVGNNNTGNNNRGNNLSGDNLGWCCAECALNRGCAECGANYGPVPQCPVDPPYGPLPIEPSVPLNDIIHYTFRTGLTLADITLCEQGKWQWVDGQLLVTAGLHSTLEVVYRTPLGYDDIYDTIILVVARGTTLPSADLAATITYTYRTGLTLSDIALNGNWQWENPSFALQVGNFINVLVTYTTGDNYYDIESFVILVIEAGTLEPSEPVDEEITYGFRTGLTLNDIDLPGNWQWANPATALQVGTFFNVLVVYATGENYNDIERMITVIIELGQMEPSTPIVDNIYYTFTEGLRFSDIALPGNWQWVSPNDLVWVGTADIDVIYLTPTGYADILATVRVEIASGVIEPSVPPPSGISYDYRAGLTLGDIALCEQDKWQWVDPSTAMIAGLHHNIRIVYRTAVGFDDIYVTITVSILELNPVRLGFVWNINGATSSGVVGRIGPQGVASAFYVYVDQGRQISAQGIAALYNGGLASQNPVRNAWPGNWVFAGWDTEVNANRAQDDVFEPRAITPESDVTYLFAQFYRVVTVTFVDMNDSDVADNHVLELRIWNATQVAAITQSMVPAQRAFIDGQNDWMPMGWTSHASPNNHIVLWPLNIQQNTTFFGQYDATIALHLDANLPTVDSEFAPLTGNKRVNAGNTSLIWFPTVRLPSDNLTHSVPGHGRVHHVGWARTAEAIWQEVGIGGSVQIAQDGMVLYAVWAFEISYTTAGIVNPIATTFRNGHQLHLRGLSFQIPNYTQVGWRVGGEDRIASNDVFEPSYSGSISQPVEYGMTFALSAAVSFTNQVRGFRLYPVWQRNAPVLTFNMANGIFGVTQDIVMDYEGMELTPLQVNAVFTGGNPLLNPTREGWEFRGWSTEQNARVVQDFDFEAPYVTTIAGRINLFPQFSRVITASFVDVLQDDATAVVYTVSVTMWNLNTTVRFMTDIFPALRGLDFDTNDGEWTARGWSTSNSAWVNPLSWLQVSEDVRLYALYGRVHTLTYDRNIPSETQNPHTVTASEFVNVFDLSERAFSPQVISLASTWAREGYTFLGWRMDGENFNRAVNTPFNLVRDIIATAEWRSTAVLASSLAVGYTHSLRIDEYGRLWAWGQNNFGQLGIGNTISSDVPVLVNGTGLLGGARAVAVEAGNGFSLSIDADGRLWSWGLNSDRQLGDGTSANRSNPVQVNTGDRMGGNGVVTISAGSSHSLAIDVDGGLWAWGSNANGRLGIGSNAQNSNPVAVNITGGDDRLLRVAAGGAHSLAIDEFNRLWSWGLNTYGQLGDATTTDRSTPVRVNYGERMGGAGVRDIAAGANHSMAVDIHGRVWTWGNNWNGQLGDNTRVNRNAPVNISNRVGSIWVTGAVAAGGNSSFVFNANGQLMAWGLNADGQLGDRTTLQRNLPVAVNMPAQIIRPGRVDNARILAVAAGPNGGMAIDEIARTWTWGNGVSLPWQV